jgi:fructokinase
MFRFKLYLISQNKEKIMKEYYGGIEAGGTKIVCSIANDPFDILAIERFPTSTPEETIRKIILFFTENQKLHNIKLVSLGIGSFGPLDLNQNSITYGSITTTPKKGWRNTKLIQPIQQALGVPVSFDTDVNAAAIGEGKWGAARGLDNFIYITIGTGIGGGVIINGKPVHGLIHPEMGHIRLIQDKSIDPYKGKCPYHNNCFEALASGPAIEERWNKKANELEPNHPGWVLEADYIAQALSNFICCFSPQKLILGGGVMQQNHLFPLIRSKTLEYLNNYVQSEAILANIEHYIVPPGLGNQSGILGAIALAQNC